MEETLAPTASKWENPLFRINFVKQSTCFAHCLERLLQKHIKSEKRAWDWKIYISGWRREPIIIRSHNALTTQASSVSRDQNLSDGFGLGSRAWNTLSVGCFWQAIMYFLLCFLKPSWQDTPNNYHHFSPHLLLLSNRLVAIICLVEQIQKSPPSFLCLMEIQNLPCSGISFRNSNASLCQHVSLSKDFQLFDFTYKVSRIHYFFLYFKKGIVLIF